MIALGRRTATTLLAATGERTRKQEQYRKEGRASIIKAKQHTYEDRRKDAQAQSTGNGKDEKDT